MTAWIVSRPIADRSHSRRRSRREGVPSSRVTMHARIPSTRFVATALVAVLFAACETAVDQQCLTDIEAHYGAPCENGTQCARPLICGAPRAGDPSVCHAAVRCESNDDCRGVHLCGVDTVCLPTSTGVNACLPMAFADAGTEMDANVEGTDAP